MKLEQKQLYILLNSLNNIVIPIHKIVTNKTNYQNTKNKLQTNNSCKSWQKKHYTNKKIFLMMLPQTGDEIIHIEYNKTLKHDISVLFI